MTINHDNLKRRLTITFEDGRSETYMGVSQAAFDAFESDPGREAHYRKYIKPVYMKEKLRDGA